MRLLPESRWTRAAGAVALAALLGLGAYWYKPWEAHYRGRPTSWWAADILRWEEESLNLFASVYLSRPPSEIADWLAWLTGNRELARHEDDLPLVKGDPAAVPVLTDLLKCPDAKVRYVAA